MQMHIDPSGGFMKRNDIYIIHGTDYKKMTIKLLKHLDLAGDIEDRKQCIGIKPNLVNATSASHGATTHPEIVDGLLTYLKEEGFWNIQVLESSWVGEKTMNAARSNGILEVCKKHGVDFLDLQKDQGIVCRGGSMEIKVCKKAMDITYMINLPVVKGHCQTKITCALKNEKGLIPNSEKRRFHTMGLHRPIAALNTIIRQDLILADNICGDLDFEEGGNPVRMDRILAFKDPVLCDSFAAESMGYVPYEIEYIRLAEELGIGSSDTTKARIHLLNEEEKVGKKVLPARKAEYLSVYVDAKNACSACYGSLIYALDRLDKKGELRGKKRKSIGIGQGYRGKTGLCGIGNCTGCFERHLEGCPPKAVDIVKFLEEGWGN